MIKCAAAMSIVAAIVLVRAIPARLVLIGRKCLNQAVSVAPLALKLI